MHECSCALKSSECSRNPQLAKTPQIDEAEELIEILIDIHRSYLENDNTPATETKTAQDRDSKHGEQAFRGEAGQPRATLAPRRPIAPSPRHRNNKRGIRSKRKTDERKERRTEKKKNS